MSRNLHFMHLEKSVMRLLLFISILAALLTGSPITALAAPNAQAGSTSVVVTVSDTQGAAAVGLNVYTFIGTTYTGLSGVTDANGQVTFNLADNSYNFRADLNGTQFFSGGVSGIDTCTIPGCTTDGITVTSPVVVTVADTTPTPQAGLNVYAFSGTTYTGMSGVTNANGQVSFTLIPGNYNFRADFNGTQFFSGGASGVNTCDIPGSGLNCTTDSVTVNLPVVVTTVFDVSMNPVPNVPVYAFSGTTYTGKSGTTDANGNVSFTLVDGSYNFRADYNGTQFFSGGASGVNTCDIPGCTSDTVLLESPVIVTVSDINGTPVQGISVYAYAGTTYANKTGVTDANGEVPFALLPDAYNFRADFNGTQFFSGGASGINTCTVPGCTMDSVTLTPPIVVTVLDTNSVPQAGLNVFAFNGTTYTGKTGTTDTNGQVSLTLVPGSYNFRADLNGTQFFSGGASGTNTCDVNDTLPTCTADSVTVTIPMVVTVNDNFNQPQAGVSVYAFNGSSYSGRSGITDANGEVTFTLLPGSYNFRADFNGGQYFSGGASGTDTCTIPGCTSDSVTVPAITPPTASLPVSTCSPSCDLYATTGTINLPDGSVTDIWGFSMASGGPAELPGPALIVNQGESVSVILHNEMAAETVALVFPGQDLVPDLDGVLPGGSFTYTFTPTEAGTLSYEAGLTTNGARQVAMGMFGALIVRPTAGAQFANNAPESAFDAEALIAVNEIDPDFHVDPNGYLMQNYDIRYWLVNGKAYPNTDPILVTPGQKLLLRYMNGGAETHYLSTLGINQTILGADGVPLPTSKTHQTVSEAIPAGSSLDTLITIPADATIGTRYALYNPGMVQLQNSSSWASGAPVDFGGMMTFIEVVGGQPVPDTGPIASNVVINPSISAATADASLSAHLDEATTGGENIDAWEYFINEIGPAGSGIAFTVGTPAPAIDISATVLASTLATLPPGDVTFYVRGQDASGDWGPVSSVVMDLVVEGPVIRGMQLTPATTNGSVDIAIQATADDTATGNVNVVAAEYFIDEPLPITPGTGTAMTHNGPRSIVSLTGTIPAVEVGALDPGTHTIFVHAMDELGNWGGGGTITLIVDQTGPVAVVTGLAPNPNNGKLPVNASSNAVRISGSFSDAAQIERAEGFLNSVGADGTGFPLIPSDGLYNLNMENGYADIPLPTINNLPEGSNMIYIHAKDIAGNWGDTTSVELLIDKTGPVVSQPSVTPNPTPRNNTVLLEASATDALLQVAAGEWFEGPDPGIGNGTPMLAAAGGSFGSPTVDMEAPINVQGWSNGNHTISVRARDSIGNWSAVRTVVLTIQPGNPNNILSDNFETGRLFSWNSVSGSAAATQAASLEGKFGLQTPLNANDPAFVVDRTPSAERGYTASFMFNPNDSASADGSVEIFVGRDNLSSQIFTIRFENGSSGPEIQAAVATAGGLKTTDWQHLSAGANKIEMRWSSGADTTFTLLINDVVAQELTGLDTSSFQLEEVMLGAIDGLKSAMSGTMYFDDFASLRPIPDPGDLPYQTYLPLVTN